jgi:ubiquinone biosynthesis protein
VKPRSSRNRKLPLTRAHLDLPDQALAFLLRSDFAAADKIRAIQQALDGDHGTSWRAGLGEWIVRLMPVESLVPDVDSSWRPLLREAMIFVVSRLSSARLAPKVLEQLELGAAAPPEVRLIRLIAKVPGLQKVGQVLARNRNLDPSLQRELSVLENGIRDVSVGEIRAVVQRELGPQIESHEVRIESRILSEASVSAVVRFSWRNPETRRRERGVFKVRKPYVESHYAEDMRILQQLARYLARRHREGGHRLASLAETLTEIRLLLEREVDFAREQSMLLSALDLYRSIPGVRVPRLIPALSTPAITALSFENGVKVTEAVARPARLRVRIAERLAEALLAIPALARQKESIFHADPHAGNLLYDRQRGDLVILDWALTERLSRPQRRSVIMLVLMMTLRDATGAAQAIEQLRLHARSGDPTRAAMIRERVCRCLDRMPILHLPGPLDAMRLLDEIALEAVRFPGSLLMFRKAFFTLEGVLEDVAGSSVRIDTVMTRYVLNHWLDSSATLVSLLSARDWAALQWSALTAGSRLGAKLLLGPWTWLPGLIPRFEAPESI